MYSLEFKTKPIVYLAAPYSLDGTSNNKDRQTRFEQITRAANQLFKFGMNVYSPITHHHCIQQFGSVKMTTREWMELDLEFLKHSVMLYVLKLDNWNFSLGLLSEIEFSKSANKPICYLEPDEFVLYGRTKNKN